MSTKDSVTCRALIRLAAGTPSSVSATEAVDVPARLAERCDLLLDLREQAGGSYEDVRLPLTTAELKAWIQCALSCESAAAGSVEGDQQCLAHEDTLLKALKVRPTFLNTLSEVVV